MADRIIAITGGIGSGKSMVSRILVSMGYSVYDCDSRAKLLMDNDDELKCRISTEISPSAIDYTGRINRKQLADIVFKDDLALAKLNLIVHGMVRRDIDNWSKNINCSTVWVETAIARESGIIDMVDAEWCVVAPIDLRIARVMKRSNMTETEIMQRIKSQNTTCADVSNAAIIYNDGIKPLLPQILNLL